MPVEDIQLDKLLDKRNITLYEDITKGCGITVSVSRDVENGLEYWSMTYEPTSKEAEVYAGKDINDINAFTHELLHVIQEENGQESHKTLPVHVSIIDSPSRFLFDNGMIIRINNVILHHRMLPDYIKLGFPINKFVYDFYQMAEVDESGDFELIAENKVKRENLSQLLELILCYRFHPNGKIKLKSQEYINNKYYARYPDLIDTINELCNNWEEELIKSNIDFFKSLLQRLDNWKSLNNLS